MLARNKKGFTLIELLIVVVIIGILAAIAIPKFSSVKQKGYKTQAISDLTSLRTAEETFFTDSNRYGTLDEITDKFSSTSGVGIPDIVPSTSYWYARKSLEQLATGGWVASMPIAPTSRRRPRRSQHRGRRRCTWPSART